jgi:hypothetical protein
MSNEWEEKRKQLNELHQELQKKPDSEKRGYSLSPGAILNAYREADISYAEAVDALQRCPIDLSTKRFLALRALCDATKVADDEATNFRISVMPYGTIFWAGKGQVTIELE